MEFPFTKFDRVLYSTVNRIWWHIDVVFHWVSSVNIASMTSILLTSRMFWFVVISFSTIIQRATHHVVHMAFTFFKYYYFCLISSLPSKSHKRVAHYLKHILFKGLQQLAEIIGIGGASIHQCNSRDIYINQ